MAARDSVNTAAIHETTPLAAMDEEPSQDSEDGTWFLVTRKRRKQGQAESNLPHNTEPTQQGQTQPMFVRRALCCRRYPIGDLKVVFRPRDGLNQREWPQHSIARASGMAAQFTDPYSTSSQFPDIFTITELNTAAIFTDPDNSSVACASRQAIGQMFAPLPTNPDVQHMGVQALRKVMNACRNALPVVNTHPPTTCSQQDKGSPYNKSHVRQEQKRMAGHLSQEEGQPGKVTFNLEAMKITAATPHRSRNRASRANLVSRHTGETVLRSTAAANLGNLWSGAGSADINLQQLESHGIRK
ncbi:hypothetical protein HPB50_025311 [Hyalomma asiaticum]|uniref:Uncharacterized protein n=1 Tax=Hyalomma asiaticum TaxID=266040 RepID=A0ACB7SQP7_HYAAI|nr:hypothetical protein HPB50_025311 [Hyalomma asiaticum]